MGFFKKEKKHKEYHREVSLIIESGADIAHFSKIYLNNYGYSNTEKPISYQAFTFTDRSIYRPGQIVHFKSIITQFQNNKTQILSNKKITATLYNVNHQEVETLELKTNEYGSISGSFSLPVNDVNGIYQIVLKSNDFPLQSYNNFSVEEYKRPKFEIQFNPITETFKVNDSVSVSGTAKAYAGSNINHAKVVYRVQRIVQFPKWNFWSRPWINSSPQEIAYGETSTNEKGEFVIHFKALPDPYANKDYLPTFQYEIAVDITDINGETRSHSTTVNVGYHSLKAEIQLKSTLDKTDKNHKIHLNTKNLNGTFVPAKGIVKIFKLKTPERTLRPRPWEAPDYQTIPEEEFLKKFPHDDYANESNPKYWKKGAMVFERSFDTKVSQTLALGNIKNWKSGAYLITLETKDKFGQTVKDQTITELYSKADKTLADHKLFSITNDKSTYQPGDNVVLTIGSSAKNLLVTLIVEKNKQIVDTQIIKLNNQKKNIKIPVIQTDLGGFIIHYSYAFANSFNSGNLKIAVPYPKTDLEIETITFRDKLQPQQNETWSFKIKGKKGEKVTAELLASMYDSSLDQFKPHQWNFKPNYTPIYHSSLRKNAYYSFNLGTFYIYNSEKYSYKKYPKQQYSHLNWYGLNFGYPSYMLRNTYDYDLLEVATSSEKASLNKVAETNIEDKKEAKDNPIIKMRGISSLDDIEGLLFIIDGKSTTNIDNINPDDILETKVLKGSEAIALYGEKGKNGVMIITTKQSSNLISQVEFRKNLQETAFFFPQLHTDKDGNVSFSFTTPESLTQWKLHLLAHTKTLESSIKNLTSTTQKELMVIPNTPRFLRHGDNIIISTKISNLSSKDLSGKAQLQLIDAVTGKEITNIVANSNTYKSFSVKQNENTQVSWSLTIPETINAIQYKIVAKAGQFSDGEQNVILVLSNRKLVTETLPMWVKSNETRTFTLDKLKSNTSKTLKHHQLTLEITSNPAWYAIQALPYLIEYPYDCNEQIFSRYYANALASHIVSSNPRIKTVFEQWKNSDALISSLEKNESLKNILIQETPWLRDAQTESEQKKRIALLFDINKMNHELKNSLRQLEQNQMHNGAWSWFNGGRESRFITQHIISGFGHLKHLNVIPKAQASEMILKAITYLDSEFVKEYHTLNKYNKDIDLSEDHLSYIQLHYLYMRSFFPEIEQSKEAQQISSYYLSQIQKYWQKKSLYSKGLMTLITYRMGDHKTTASILKSLKENSIINDELGMFWKANTTSWHWYQAPIETQALMIEAFSEAGLIIQDQKSNFETIDNLKIWLLKNKQTNKWKTTKSTVEAVYALLLQGNDWISISEAVDVSINNQPISTEKQIAIEAGTGYYKTSWEASEITADMAKVTLSKKDNGIAWGSLYWQYFEDLDKITSAETTLKLKKQLFKKTNTDRGEELIEITPKTDLNVGDLIRVRIELRSDRNIEFVHMKDMRASGLEPLNVLSQYKWQDGLGYYESTKDASTNFFFDFLPKGIYIFEYDLRVNNSGNMSNGITTIQSMYAPEFSSHSEGVRISVKN